VVYWHVTDDLRIYGSNNSHYPRNVYDIHNSFKSTTLITLATLTILITATIYETLATLPNLLILLTLPTPQTSHTTLLSLTY
jgi:hypothetical protein